MQEFADRPPRASYGLIARALGWAVLVAVFLGLCGRALDYPLNRDENLFITVSVMGGFDNLYTYLGYNHLPYLPWLLGGIYRLTGTDHYLLVGRLVILVGWVLALLALWLIARNRRLGFSAFWSCAILLMGNVLLLGPPGMLVSNNFLPVPVALLATFFLLKGLNERRQSSTFCLLAGLFVSLTIGLKANYIFLAPVFAFATLLIPAGRPVATRLVHQSIPLAIGGLIGGLPALIVMASAPKSFFAHTIRYFTQMQPAYWAHATEPKVASLPQKVMLAESIWGSGASLLAITGVAALFVLPIIRKDWRASRAVMRFRPLWIVLVLALCGFVIAFVPTPSFPQYFVPPIPFLIVALMLMPGSSEAGAGKGVLVALALVALICSVSRVGPGLVELARPGKWYSVAIHRDMRKLMHDANLRGGENTASLSPALAMEAGLTVPPEFAAGQFVYRVAEYVPASDRAYYTSTSPRDLIGFLATRRPDTILVSGEEAMEQPFAHYAAASGYQEYTLPSGKGPHLFRRP